MRYVSGRLAVCSALLLSLAGGLAGPAGASSLNFTNPTADRTVMGFNDPYQGYNGTQPPNPYNITAQVGDLPPAPPNNGHVSATITSMNFVINGQTYGASAIVNNVPAPYGIYRQNIATIPNPSEIVFQATANVTIVVTTGGYPGSRTTTYETVSTPTWRFIVSDIYVKDTNWINTASSIWDSVNNKVLPDPATHPYYYGHDFTNNTQYHNPAVYVKSASPGMSVEMMDRDMGGQSHPFTSGGAYVPAVRLNWAIYLTKLSGGAEPNYPATGTLTVTSANFTLPLPQLSYVVDKLNSTQDYHFSVQFSDGVGGPNNDGWVTAPSTYATGSDAAYNGIPVYVVYNTPSSNPDPNALDYPLKLNPWLIVLDNSCQFAADHGAVNGAFEVGKFLTINLFYSGRFRYPQSTGSYWTGSPPNYDFELTDFLNTSVNAAQCEYGNCMDVSDYLCILANTQGLGFQVEQFVNTSQGLTTGFSSNYICLIGSDTTQDYAYTVSQWGWHQIALSGGNVYDVCAGHKTDLSGNGFRYPPFNWPLYSYWQTSNNLPPPNNTPIYWGLVNSPASSAPTPKDNSADPNPTGPTGIYTPYVE